MKKTKTAKKEVRTKINFSAPMNASEYLIKYSFLLIVVAPLFYFVFGFSNQDPFWLYTIRIATLLLVIDLAWTGWRQWKTKKRK
jgi:hypothetical protein